MPPDDLAPRWRVTFPDGRTVELLTERGARTAAALRTDGGRSRPAVEYLDGDGWHESTGLLDPSRIPDREPTDDERAQARSAVRRAAHPIDARHGPGAYFPRRAAGDRS